MNEHNAQRLLVAWFRKTYPLLASLFFAIPNGGRRSPATAAMLRDEGVTPGVPDLFLAVPRGGKSGLFLELKAATKGRLSTAQKAVLAALEGQGYATAVPKGYEDAKQAVLNYLEQP